MNTRFVHSSEGTQVARDQFASALQGAMYKLDFDSASDVNGLPGNSLRYPESILEYNIVDIDSSVPQIEDNDNAGICVVKLFERCVDLSQFGPKTPLYEMCKIWMRDDGGSANVFNEKNQQ